jgi:DNA-binding PadR family transcriptional regulator
MSELALFDFEVLLFVSIRPREQVSISNWIPILERLKEAGLVSVYEPYPDLPDQNIWMVTQDGLTLIREWQQNDRNRHRQYGPSSVLPK